MSEGKVTYIDTWKPIGETLFYTAMLNDVACREYRILN